MPASRLVHIDRLNTAIAVSYRNQLTSYIGDEISPRIKVPNKSDSYSKWPIDTWFRRPSTTGIKRAPGAPFKRRDFDVGTGNYKTEQFGIEFPLDDSIKTNADAAFRMEQVPVEILTEDVVREREIRLAALLGSTANLTQNITLAGASQWNDVNSNIVKHIEDACDTIFSAIGRAPNLVSFPRQVWRSVKHHPDLLDRIKYKDRKEPTVSRANIEEIFSDSFDPATKILIPKAIYDSSAEGQSSTLTPIWGKDVLIAYIAPSPTLEQPSLTNTLEFMGITTVRYREEKIDSDVFRVMEDVQEALVDARCGYLIKSATA